MLKESRAKWLLLGGAIVAAVALAIGVYTRSKPTPRREPPAAPAQPITLPVAIEAVQPAPASAPVAVPPVQPVDAQ